MQPIAMRYAVHDWLGTNFPGYCVIETQDIEQGVARLTKRGIISARPVPSVASAVLSFYDIERDRWGTDAYVCSQVLTWQGEDFLMIRNSYRSQYCDVAAHWFVGTSEESTRALAALCMRATHALSDEILVFQSGSWFPDRELAKSLSGMTWDDVILPAQVKQQVIKDTVGFFEAREDYERHAIPWRRGVLFMGPPGNGKTQTIRAILNSVRVRRLYVRSMTSRYEDPHALMSAVFARARVVRPCVMVFEDLDSMLSPRNLSFFLNELDGLAANEGLLVIGTSNHPERLDPAILHRPSRFDRKVTFHNPGPSERSQYWDLLTRTWSEECRLSQAGHAWVVEHTEGFSFAYLKELAVSSLMDWARGAESMESVVRETTHMLRGQVSSGMDALGIMAAPSMIEDAEEDQD